MKITQLFSEEQIEARVSGLAAQIAVVRQCPDLAVPILVGAFVFAADLLRALAKRGVSLPVEFLRLRSYDQTRGSHSNVTVLIPPSDIVRGRHVLLLDGVLDHGRTLAKARELLVEAGAAHVTTAVAVDKRRETALLKADFAAFANVSQFIVGYGMDDAGQGRGLPYIAIAE